MFEDTKNNTGSVKTTTRRLRRNTCLPPKKESKAMRRKRLALFNRNEGTNGLRAAISRSKSPGAFTLAGSGKV